MTTGPTKIPPQQIPGQTPPAKPQAQPNVLLQSVPADLADVKRAIEIKGQVIRNNPDGTVKIRTDHGDIDVRVQAENLQVRSGDVVTVEIPPGRPPQSARVTSDPETPAPPPPRTAQTPVNVEVRGQRPAEMPPAMPTQLSEGQIVRLEPLPPQQAAQYSVPPEEIIVTDLPEIVQNAGEVAAQNAASDLIREVIDILAPPLTTGNPAPATPAPVVLTPPLQNTMPLPPPISQPSLALIGTPLAPGNTPSVTPNLPPPGSPQGDILPNILQPTPLGTPITTPVQTAPQTFPEIQLTPIVSAPFRAEIGSLEASLSPAIVTPKIPPTNNLQPEAFIQNIDKPLILQNQKAGEIPAVVIGATPQNLPVIAMISPITGEEIFFIMHVPGGSVVPGTQLSLIPQQPLAAATMPITATVSFAPMQTAFLTPEPWPLMDEIYQTLAQIMPQAARAMAAMTPSANNPAQIGPAALFFIAAVRGGDLSQWLGSGGVDALRRGGKSGLLSRLSQESGALNKLGAEPVSQDWRGMSVPFMMDNHMHKIALYYKNDSEREQKDQQGGQTRFIFDLNLTSMGKVQMDGLFRSKRLDLIVRTQQPFSQLVQQDMRRLYAGALGETSITGDLSFQNKPEQWVTITPDKKNIGISA